jgi:RNA polymerase sigma-70 factor (ECF subfamily)
MGQDDALEAAIAEAWAAGRAAWPDVAGDPAAFAARLRAIHADGGLAELRAGDVYLAVACVAGERAALAAFERVHVAPVRGVLIRAGYPAALVDDAVQVLRVRLLVTTPERAAKLDTYRGRGSLTGWLRVVALRQARAMLGPRPDRTDSAEQIGAGARDLELAVLARSHADVIWRLVRAAVEALDDRARAVLRLEIVDGLPHERIAALYGVHRTTVLRWIDDARGAIAAGVKRALRAELGLGADTADSLLRSLAYLDLSIGTALG